MYTHIMVRFGELNTKGKNKKDFINQLYKNIKTIVKEFTKLELIKTHDRIYIKLNGEDGDKIMKLLTMISGIQNFSKVIMLEKNREEIINYTLKLASNLSFKTFKVHCRRADKNFPIHSDEMNRAIASLILKNCDCKVDIHHPDVTFHIEVRQDGAYLYNEIVAGLGGFPLGVQGKALLLMSGGIDSPVAGFMMMRRGIKIEAIHFASPPYTSEGAITKVKDLLKVLAKIQGDIKLTIIPFTRIQEEIYKGNNEAYNITIMRRMMYRISEKVLLNGRSLCLCAGESIGQVASQTLESMKTINEVIRVPMIRPLATYDKNEIIDIAKKIGTYEISIRPFIDCCTIFTPVNPTTKPTSKLAEKYEDRINYQPLIEECIANAEVVYINNENELDKEIADFL